MDPNKGNAVGRLFLLLQHFSRMSDATTNLLAFSNYTGLEARATRQLYSALAAAMTLPGEARAAFGRVNVNDVLPFDRVMSELDRADAAVLEMTRLDNSCAGVKGLIDAGTLVAFEFASRSVDSVEPDPAVTAEQLDAIRAATEALIKAIRLADDLPPVIRRVLLEHAEAVMHALNTVDITGAGELVRQRDRLEGHIRRQPSSFMGALANSTVGKAFMTFSILLAGAAATVHEALALTQDVQKLYQIVDPRSIPAIEAPTKGNVPPALKAPGDDPPGSTD